MLHFAKYHSLGNNFILLDWLDVASAQQVTSLFSDPAWRSLVVAACNKETGIGADGLLIMAQSSHAKHPSLFVFNRDGSNGEICLNGLRCAAYHLANKQQRTSVSLIMGNKLFSCTIQCTTTMDARAHVRTICEPPIYHGVHHVTVPGGQTFEGHVLDAGNPHCVIFQQIARNDLVPYAKQVEKSAPFASGTNTHFVWSTHVTKQKTGASSFLLYSIHVSQALQLV